MDKLEQSIRNTCSTVKRFNSHVTGVPKGDKEVNGAEKIFEKTWSRIFIYLMKDNQQSQEAQ